jgi:hypothetical protein
VYNFSFADRYWPTENWRLLPDDKRAKHAKFPGIGEGHRVQFYLWFGFRIGIELEVTQMTAVISS